MDKESYIPYFIYLSGIKGLGPVKINQIIKKLDKMKLSIIDFFHGSVDYEKHFLFLNDEMLNEIKNYSAHIYKDFNILNHLKNESILVKLITENNYPGFLKDSLGLSSPPILYLLGNESLIYKEGLNIAIVGTRNPSILGRLICQHLGSLSRDKYTVVSGNAKGIDTIAHQSALLTGGSTIYVLGNGLLNYKFQNDNPAENALVLSEFYPLTNYHSGLLMARNKTIAALSYAVIVVESKYNGGAYNTGIHALSLNKKLYSFTTEDKSFEQSGNIELINLGASEIKINENNLNDALENVVEAIISDWTNNIKSDYQLGLFD